MNSINQALLALLDLVFALDQEGRFLYIGSLTARAFGSDRDRLIGAPLTSVALPPTVLQQLMQDYRAIFASERPTRGEIRLPVFYQDAAKDYEYTFSPVRGRWGTVEAAVFIAKDITERKQAETALQESEAKYRALFEAASDIILILDATTYRVLNANWAAARKLGYTRRELLELSVQDFEAPLEPTRQAEIIQRLEMDGEIIYEHCYRRKNGSMFPVEINAQLIEYEEQLAIQSFVRDISERKQAEETLRQQQQQLESIAANFPGIIYREVTHSDGSVTVPYISEGIRQFAGLTPAAVKARPEALMEFVEPSDRPSLEAQFQYCQQTLQSLDVEYRSVHPDGTVNWLREIARFSRSPSGDVVADGVTLDVTDRREAQLALERQLGQERLLRQVVEQIHQSFDLATILRTTADSVLIHLQADRVLISRFRPDWSAEVLTQAVMHEGLTLEDRLFQQSPCTEENLIQYFQQGEIEMTGDVYHSNLSPAFVEFLAQLQVRSHLVVPILVRRPDAPAAEGLDHVRLWGLLIVHQCIEVRQWQIDEVNLLKQLSTQVGIAIYQSELYQNLQNELQERTRAETEVRALNAELEHRVQERTLELQTINQNLNHEISVRRQVETALRASERLYATLATLSPVGIFHTDAAGHCVYVNQRCCEILGFSEAEALNQPWEARLHPEDRQRVVAAWQQASETRMAYRVECRVTHASETPIWIIAQGQPELNEAGEIIGFVSTITDITELKRYEADLRRYERIISATKDGISLVDRHYIYRAVNQTYQERMNRPLAEIIGQSVASLHDRTTFETVIRPRLDRCFAGEAIQYEEWFDLATAERCYLSIRYFPYTEPDGSIAGAVVSIRDITALKQAEEALAVSEAKLKDILNSAGATIGYARVFADRTWVNEFISNNCFEITGYTQAELTSELWDSRIFAEDFGAVSDPVFDAIFSESSTTVEYRFLHKDGSTRWLSESITSRYSDAEDCWMITLVTTDVSDRKRSEEKLSALFQYLGIGIVILEPPRLTLASANPAFQKLLGYSATELASMTCTDFSHPDDLAIEKSLIEECQRGERDSYQIEKRYIRKDRQEIWVNLTASIVRDAAGQFKLGICAAEDITLRKALAHSLRLSQAALEDILDNLDVSILRLRVLDGGEAVMEFISSGCEAVFGFTAEEITNDVSVWMAGVDPDDLEAIVLPSRQRVCDVGQDAITYRFRHRDGQIRQIYSQAIARRDDLQNCWFLTAIESTRPLIRS
ncbi:MAG: PAS domain S-box protein [Elainellaceae cyanobacterium]